MASMTLVFLFTSMKEITASSLITGYVPLYPYGLFWAQFHLDICLVINIEILLLLVKNKFFLCSHAHFPVSAINFHSSSHHYTPWARMSCPSFLVTTNYPWTSGFFFFFWALCMYVHFSTVHIYISISSSYTICTHFTLFFIHPSGLVCLFWYL